MNTNRTADFYKTAQEYRAGLTRIWDVYTKEMLRLERFKGSPGYDEDAKKAEQQRKTAIKELQQETRGRFAGIIRGMKQSAQAQPMTAPSADQLAILQALKMREKLTRGELEQAANALQNCPLALSVLGDLAAKYEIHGVSFSIPSTAAIAEHITSLENGARRLCTLEKPNSKREMLAKTDIHSPEHDSTAIYALPVDRDYLSEADFMAHMGGVNDLAAFQKAVNN